MTPSEFEQRMRAALAEGPEEGHIEADNLMCQVLRDLGYEKGADLFAQATKWYA